MPEWVPGPYCPSALIFLTPPRGIGWGSAASECSAPARGSKCLGAKGKQRGFCWEAECVCACVWSGLGKETSLRRATEEVAIQCKSPEALTQRNGEVQYDPCYVILWSHVSMKWIYNTFKTTCLFLLAPCLLIRRGLQHQLNNTQGHSRAKAQYINRLFFYSTTCSHNKDAQYVQPLSPLWQPCKLHRHRNERNEHLAASSFLKQEAVPIPSNSPNTHTASINNPTTGHTYAVHYSDTWTTQ